MSLSRRMKKAALRANLKAAANKNGASNSQFGKAIEEQEDSYLASVLGSINKSSFMKKVLFNAIGLTLMAATPNFAGEITGVSGTSVVKDGTTYTINTADANFKGNTAFNAFSKFKLDHGEIANMMVGKHAGTSAPVTGIDNVVNFVGSQININGVLNTIKVLDEQGGQKLGGNLYFLSSDGLVIGSQGVVNTGSFYAIVPNKEFMDKFIDFTQTNPEFKEGSLVAPNGDWDATGQQGAVNNIIKARIKNGDGEYSTDGITLAENGQITINGKINVKNAIGLFAARKYDSTKNSAEQASNIVIGPNAELNVLSSDVFGTYVNIDNEEFLNDAEFDSTRTGVEIVSVGYKGENATSGGFANGIKAEGILNSRTGINIVSQNYQYDGDEDYAVSDARGNISLSGKIEGLDYVGVEANNADINISDKAVVVNEETTYKSAEIKAKYLSLSTTHGDIKDSVNENNTTDHKLLGVEHDGFPTNFSITADNGQVNLAKTSISSENANVDITANKGITIKNVAPGGGSIEIANKAGQYGNEVSGDITISGELNSAYESESQTLYTNVKVENVSDGDIVLNNATINAGTVAMTAKSIKDAENTTNSITANNQDGVDVLSLNVENNIELANTTLTANKAGIFVSASKGSVTLDEVTAGFREGSDSNQNTNYNNVKVQAHSGIKVGDVFASGEQGIILSNNLTVEGENQQTINATGNIEAGNLTAQEIRNYGQDQQEINNHDIFINNTNSEDNHLYGALPNENRNVTINNLTGSNVTINALGKVATAVKQNETETNILKGYQLNINTNSVDAGQTHYKYLAEKRFY